MTDAELSGLDAETLSMILSAIGEFADRNLTTELLLRLDRDDECPEAVVRRMCGDDLGIHLLFVPDDHGGMGAGSLDVCRVCERMAGIDLGVATSVLATALGSDPIAVGATPDQKKTWLGRMAAEGLLFAYGATEPEAGSDLGALKTVAVPVVEDGRTTGYRITGRKQWISNGGIADAYSVLANAPGGPSWFVVERDAPGFTRAKPEDKHGIRLSNTAALFLDDVAVTPDALVGGTEGRGLLQAQLVFGHTRLMVAAFGLGAGWAALDRAIAYAADRIQAGGPLSRKQGYTHGAPAADLVRCPPRRRTLGRGLGRSPEARCRLPRGRSAPRGASMTPAPVVGCRPTELEGLSGKPSAQRASRVGRAMRRHPDGRGVAVGAGASPGGALAEDVVDRLLQDLRLGGQD
ncbi:acyl-CoA dehydrogenase family protein [Amycolatopsis sp. cg9]|uniref:acyl-CoA dehydrogenase family protein n=1 Tax=Amycolatopsis sp. cg9 TaxID=3238801 RepID=UPI00352468C2